VANDHSIAWYISKEILAEGGQIGFTHLPDKPDDERQRNRRRVALLTDPRMEILCLGGRFSRFLAGILQRCLHHLREGTRLLDGTAADLVDEIASLGRRDVLVVFDYRRYQTDVVRFASEASARGVHIILFTDQWASPIAELAEVVITAPTATSSPFDTLVTPLLQVEAVTVGVAERMGADWRSRAALLEEVRNDHNVTLDSPSGLVNRKRQRKG
jgi:DNA-binding MurR/RpiR family transcriptional regulator